MRTKEGHQRGGLERFAQITTRSDGTSAFGKHVVVGGDENDRRRNALGRQSLLKIESAQTAEVDIEHNALRVAGNIAPQKLFRGSERLDADSIDSKGTRERNTEGRIIVDDADPRMLEFRAYWTCPVRSCQANPNGGDEPL